MLLAVPTVLATVLKESMHSFHPAFYSRQTYLQRAGWFTAGTLIYRRQTDLQRADWFTAGTLIYSRQIDLQQAHWFTAGTLIYRRHTDLQRADWFTAGTLIYSGQTDLQQAHWFTAGRLIYSRQTDLQEAHWFTAGRLICSRQTEQSESLWPSLARTHHLGSSFIPSAVYVIIIVYISHALVNALSAHMIHINLNTILCTQAEHSPAKTIYVRFKRTLFIRTKHSMRIFGVIPLYQATKRHLNNI